MKYIKSIEIKNSPFFEDNMKIDFSENLNCIMGGRGTGKSTLLHFIKSTIIPESENNNTTYNLLQNNLGEGEIILTMQAEDDNTYNISKQFNDEPNPELSDTGDIIPIQKILKLLECDIYETSRIEEIGRRPEDRLELLDKKLPEEAIELKDEMQSIVISLDKSAKEIRNIKARYQQKLDKVNELSSVSEEIKLMKKTKPKDVNESLDKEFVTEEKKLKQRRSEKKYVGVLLDFYEEISSSLESLSEEIATFKTNNNPKEYSFANTELMQKITDDFNSTTSKLIETTKKMLGSMKLSTDGLKTAQKNLEEVHQKQNENYIKIKKKIEINREYYTRLEELSKKEDLWKSLDKECKELDQKKKKLELDRIKLVTEYNKKKQRLYSLRIKVVEELNKQFNGDIKIILTIGGLVSEYENTLKVALRGSGLKYNELVARIVQSFPPDKFAEIIHNKDKEKLKSIFHIDEERSNTLIEKLYETDFIYNIETLYCPDLPDFYLRIPKGKESKKDNYVKSDQLSTGQRCTTVLPIVFAVSENPLLIDQPEDNLDNKYITQNIFQIITKQKQKRQLIFITHNPNIPVLSDSEFNLFLNFDKKSNILSKGSVEDVKENILNVLEGGKEAFERRNSIYKIFAEE
jgi:energy-coupling factor transporter ATP-binding protein EcfA2